MKPNNLSDKTTLQGAASKPLRTRDKPLVIKIDLTPLRMPGYTDTMKSLVDEFESGKEKDLEVFMARKMKQIFPPFEKVVDKDSPNFPFS